jgi:hypothetical protein
MKGLTIAAILLSLCVGCVPPTLEPWPTSIIRTVVVTELVPAPTQTPYPTYTPLPTYTPPPPIVVTVTPRPTETIPPPTPTATRPGVSPADAAFYMGYTNCFSRTTPAGVVVAHNPDTITTTYKALQGNFADLAQCQAFFQPKITATLQVASCISALPEPTDVVLQDMHNSLLIFATDIVRIRVNVFGDNLCKVPPEYLPTNEALQAYKEARKHALYIQDLLTRYRREHGM